MKSPSLLPHMPCPIINEPQEWPTPFSEGGYSSLSSHEAVCASLLSRYPLRQWEQGSTGDGPESKLVCDHSPVSLNTIATELTDSELRSFHLKSDKARKALHYQLLLRPHPYMKS